MSKLNIITLTNTVRVSKILKKSSAKMFKDLKVGDTITLSVEAKAVGGNTGGSHAVYMLIVNDATGEKTIKSFNEVQRVLNSFEFEEV